MKLFEAKQKARKEFAEVLDAYDITVEEIREFVKKHPKYGKATHVIATTSWAQRRTTHRNRPQDGQEAEA